MRYFAVILSFILLWRDSAAGDLAGNSRLFHKNQENKRFKGIKGGSTLPGINSLTSDPTATYVTEDVPLGLSLSHVMPVSDCLASLSVDISYGLTEVDVQVRRNKYGHSLTHSLIHSLTHSFTTIL
jgi:hypothetical protein